mgnify:CR=1 FL=1
MAKALESGKVAAYVSDFASDEILEQENAITLPHLGASTPESEDNCAKMAVYEITEYLEKGTIRNSVNFPNLKVPYEGGYRICMIHKNIPNMIASITSAVRCNIENMATVPRVTMRTPSSTPQRLRPSEPRRAARDRRYDLCPHDLIAIKPIKPL